MLPKKDVTPQETDVVNQANQISRASYSMPVMQRRIVFLAMAQVRDDEPDRAFTMRVSDVLKALGMSDNRYSEIRGAVEAVFDNNKVSVDTPKGWKIYTWLTEAEYLGDGDDIQAHTLSLTLNRNILPFAKTLRGSYAQFSIADIAKLQGRHTLRLFELLTANSGHSGKSGNAQGEWFYEVSIEDYRKLLKIREAEYKVTWDFRKRVIDAPVTELNEANLGLRVSAEYLRKGKFLVAVRFACKRLSKTELKPAKPQPATQTELEDEAWIACNPDLWEKHLLEAEKQQELFPTPFRFPQAEALQTLKKDPKAIHPKQPKKRTNPVKKT